MTPKRARKDTRVPAPRQPVFPGAVLLCLLAGVVYFPALGGEFIFDDILTITQNPLIHDQHGLWRIWFTTAPLDYFPLTLSSFWVEWRLWGRHTLGYHLLNVILHAGSAVLLWRILAHLKLPGAWLAAAVFAVHPLCVASVAWITERKNTLSMLFFLWTILLFLRAEMRFESHDVPGGKRLHRWSLGTFLLALLSKTSVVMLPVVLLGHAWWKRGRITRVDAMRALPFFGLSLVLGLVTVWFQFHRASAGEAVVSLGFLERLAGAGWAVWFYLGKTLLPVNLAMFYPGWTIDVRSPLSYAPGALFLATLGVCWRFRQTWGKHWIFALGFFAVMLFPVLGFFDMFFFMYSRVADQWAYLSSIGVIALVVCGGTHLLRRFSAHRPPESGRVPAVARIVATAILLALSVLTLRQAAVFQNEETLWRDTIRKNPRSWSAYNNLGLYVEERGRLEEAATHYAAATKVKPDFELGHYNLAIVREKQNKFAEAKQHYRAALRARPTHTPSRNNLANILSVEGDTAAAIAEYRIALKHKPDFVEAHFNISLALEKQGRREDSIHHLRETLRLNPDHKEAREQLAELTGEAVPATARR